MSRHREAREAMDESVEALQVGCKSLCVFAQTHLNPQPPNPQHPTPNPTQNETKEMTSKYDEARRKCQMLERDLDHTRQETQAQGLALNRLTAHVLQQRRNTSTADPNPNRSEPLKSSLVRGPGLSFRV